MINDIENILITKEEIDNKVKELAKEITKDYKNKDLFLVGVLKGAIVFISDIAREIKVPLELDFMAVSSYGESTESSGVVRILKDLELDLRGKDVLIVEDIIDSGLTLSYLLKNLKSRGARSIEICTLLDKPDRRKVDIAIKYKGFDIPDEFVVGYGLDFNEKYRNFPEIGVLKSELYETE